MRDEEKTLAGVEIVSILLRKSDTLIQVTGTKHPVASHILANGYSHMRFQQKGVR